MKKRIFAFFYAAAVLFTVSAAPADYAALAAQGSKTLVRLDPSNESPFNGGEFQGWGTSMGWWGNRIGYSDKLAKQAAELFYDEDKGLGLDIVRYNVGGGDHPDHNHVTRSDSKLPCFAVPELDKDKKPVKDSDGNFVYTFDWTKDKNQVNVLKEIKNKNNDVHIEGYTNSPPWFMTNSLCSGGGVNAAENLAPANYGAFADFLVDVTEHFKSEGLKFDSYSPMNEPNPATGYWGANSEKQEGNHVAPGDHQSGLINALSDAYDKANIDTLVVGLDETSIDYSISSFNSLSDTAKKNLDRLDTHTYGGSNRAGLKSTAVNAGKNLWMSEVDGDWNGFGLAERIITDMNGMMPSAWVMWDIIDAHKDSSFTDPKGNKSEANASLNVTGALWGVAMANHDTENIELANKYYAYGQFTRYINPGDTIIASSNSTLAAYNKKTGDIKIVALNSGSSDKNYVFDLSAFTNIGTEIKEIRSNNAEGSNAEHWKEIENEAALENKKIETTLKAGTITTFVVTGAGETDYAIINGGGNQIGLGSSARLSLSTNLSGDITWSVFDGNIASITPDGKSCIVTAENHGDFTVYATVGSFTVSKSFTVPSYKLSGTASWGSATSRPSDDADYTKAADGDLSTYYDGVQNGYVQYDFGTPFKATAFRLAAREGSGMSDRTKGSEIQASNDGIEWISIYKLASAIPAGEYTEISAAELSVTNAFRYYRYTNTENMANIAEFQIDGAPSSDTPVGAPVIMDINELTDDFEGTENIFSAAAGEIKDGGKVVFDSGLARYGNVFAPVKTTAAVSPDKPIELTNRDKFRLKFDMFSGWESSGKENSFAIKDKDGNEIAAFRITGGGYTLQEVRIGGKNILKSTAVAQSRSNPGTGSKVGANGWNASGQPYVNTVGYNKTVEFIIDGTGKVSVALTGGMEDVSAEGTVQGTVTIGSIELTGDYNSAAERTVSYDNFDADLITYDEPLATPAPPTPVPTPTSAPVLPESGELISLNFDNKDLTSSSSYGKAEGLGTPIFAEIDGRTCLQLNNSSGTAIKLTDSNGNPLLTGQKNITVSFKVKPTSTGTSWWLYAAPNDNAQTYEQEKYIGILGGNGTLTFERYNNSGGRSVSASGPYAINEWNDVIISVSDDMTEIYVNGSKIGEAASTVNISDLLSGQSVAYIGRANWGGGEYATGYIDDFVIYNYVFADILADTDLGDLSAVKEDISIPNALANGIPLTWTSSDPDTITNDGSVTRSDDTKMVTLTVTASDDGREYSKSFEASVIGLAAAADTFTAYNENGEIKYTSGYSKTDTPYDMYVALYDGNGVLTALTKDQKEGSFKELKEGTYTAVCYIWDENMTPRHSAVTKKVKAKREDEMGAYLFVHFVGDEGSEEQEQIYFSVSENGTEWKTLNNKQPILKSSVGEKGVRDPFILRGEDGKFFIIATDLSIYNLSLTQGDNTWSYCQKNGSKSIVVWESDDLTHWSKERIVKVADDNVGCVWAPEAAYDPEKDAYMVFWASKISSDNYGKQRMYRSYTSDFETFTPPEVYIDNSSSAIDTTIISEKGVYYRFTKDETHSAVTMMKSTSLSNGWKDVETYTINGEKGNTVTGYEGPTIYKLNGEQKWCLLLDYYSKKQGYKPFVTDDIAKGAFTAASDFTFDMKYRHGTVMPITTDEYNTLLDTYGE